jgi:hypothetical protein
VAAVAEEHCHVQYTVANDFLQLMFDVIYKLSSWFELAGIIIPLITILRFKPKGGETRPLVFYVIGAFFLNLCITIIAKLHGRFVFIPENNFLFYNIHSVVKVLFFGWYLYMFKILKSSLQIKVLLAGFLIFIVINFLFFQSLTEFSDRVANTESILLLIFCSSFFLSTITDNSDTIWMHKPVFIVCASINLYAALNFFVFLFFNYLNVEERQKAEFSRILMLIFSFSYLFLCIILSIVLKREHNKAGYQLNDISQV